MHEIQGSIPGTDMRMRRGRGRRRDRKEEEEESKKKDVNKQRKKGQRRGMQGGERKIKRMRSWGKEEEEQRCIQPLFKITLNKINQTRKLQDHMVSLLRAAQMINTEQSKRQLTGSRAVDISQRGRAHRGGRRAGRRTEGEGCRGSGRGLHPRTAPHGDLGHYVLQT